MLLYQYSDNYIFKTFFSEVIKNNDQVAALPQTTCNYSSIPI